MLKKLIHLQVFLLFKNMNYSVFKVFYGIFIHLINFKILECIYQYIENNIM
jgi:hypothetical protein